MGTKITATAQSYNPASKLEKAIILFKDQENPLNKISVN